MLTNAAPKSPTYLDSAALAGGCSPTSRPAANVSTIARVRDISGVGSPPRGQFLRRAGRRSRKLAAPMLATELELPTLRPHRPALRGERVPRRRWRRCDGHDGWLAANPFGYTVLDREAGEFFLRTKERGVSGADDRAAVRDRRRAAARGDRQATSSTSTATITGGCGTWSTRRWRRAPSSATGPAMRRFLEQLLAARSAATGVRVHRATFAKPYPSLVIAEVMGAPLEDAPRLHHWSNWIQRQFDAGEPDQPSGELIERGGGGVLRLRGRADRRAPRGARRRPDLGADPGRGGGRPAERRRAAQPDPEHPGRRGRHQPEPARPRGAAAGRASRPVAAAARGPARARRSPRSRRRSATSRSRRSPPGSRSRSSSTAASRSRPDSSCWSRPGTPTATASSPTRSTSPPQRPRARVLTFGAGVHYCVGANLARAEMQEGAGVPGRARRARSSSTASPSSGRRQGSTVWRRSRSLRSRLAR